MPNEPLSAAELDALRAFDTPTICNALEVVAPERRALGFTTQTLICPFPELPPIVGYARTAMIRSALPQGLSAAEQRKARLDYYRYVAAGSGAKIVVIQDVDSRIGFGCFWGEVQTAIHKGLGCLGLVTDGGVRDLDAVAPEFQVLCGKVTPSHAWVHSIAHGGTVDVFGMVVRSDDLIHADRHGAVVIPPEVAREVADAARLCGRREEPILNVARSPDFSLEALERAMAEAAEIH
jgi:regulator of RNase E activity RraA